MPGTLTELFFEALERFHRAGAVDVDHDVELLWEPGLEVVALAFRFGAVDNANRALEQWPLARGADRRIVEH